MIWRHWLERDFRAEEAGTHTHCGSADRWTDGQLTGSGAILNDDGLRFLAVGLGWVR